MGTQWHTTFWAPESLKMVTAAMKLKDACSYGNVMTNLDNMCKSRDITLPTEVHVIKALVFPGVIYGCESWTIKKAEHWRIDAFELWCWRRRLRVLGLQGEPTSPSERQSVLNIWWKDWCRSWNFSTLATWCEELPHMKRPGCWERLKMGREGIDRGWDGWMALPTQWTWVWVKSGTWWWTGKSGVLKSMGSQSRTRLSDWGELSLIPWHMDVQFPQHRFGGYCLFSIEWSYHFCQKFFDHMCEGIAGLWTLFHWFIILSLWQYQTVFTTVALWECWNQGMCVLPYCFSCWKLFGSLGH